MKIKSSSDNNTVRLFSRSSQDTAADATIQSEIDALNPKLLGINKQIHNDPELGYAEFHAHDNITALLEAQGFKVTRHAYGVPTAFQAEYGSGGRVVAFNAEYDALPEIGHACGHNLIATISIAGFLGLAKAIKKFKIAGRVRLLGTPAEEGGGGKLKLIDAGAYRDVDACLMIHPGPEDGLIEDGFTGDAYMPTLANHKFTVQYTGKAAHAALAPWQGVNALDAVVLAYNAISVLRQQIKPDERIHGVISGGGSRPNIITAYGSLDYYIRAPSLKAAEELVVRAKKCFEGAALATGCSVEFKDINTYADLMPNKTICSLYTSAMSDMGSPVRCEFSSPPLAGSTDMGNVSYECPGFQGYCGIPAAPGAYNHTPGFTAAAGTEEAHTRAIATGKGIAMVGWKILTDDIVAEAIKQDFEDDLTRKDRAVVSPVRSGGCF